uniref:Cytosolic endo-beta-N-acetylglucosaminidase n=1 Tax=Equus asinus asinus TaxID=83772 RepID=A0A8C4PHX4_EQUAS
MAAGAAAGPAAAAEKVGERPGGQNRRPQPRGGPSGRSRIEEEQEEAVFRQVVSFSPEPLPGRYYDKDTTKPISFYLSSLEELLAWTPNVEDGFNVALQPSECRQPPLSSRRPRTLLCHDMMGGYLDDKFIQGAAVHNPYSFYHWQYIDIFVYFSHHTVTIPPVGWTNAAHRHGVCVLGTFITEWIAGGQLCEAFLAGDERSYQVVADQLVSLARFFRFDGWLINIENSLSLAAVGNMPRFLRYLTTQLHQHVPRGLVLWYDSVVSSGQLKWQNELNEHNRVFFDSYDGFFTNYNWREEHLERMLALAGERLADVYVGVDVFARGNVVGGRFDTDKSLELIRKHGFSAALFAPGWVYECLEKKDFFQNQDKFWSLLERYLPTHSICSLPFVTSFCLGMGTRRVCYGQEEAVGPWYHPSAQEIQPLFGEHRLEGARRGWVKTHCCLADAWNGGSSLLIRGAIPREVGDVAVRLFSLQVPVPPRIFLSMVYKLEGPTDVGVALELTTGSVGSCHIGGISALNGEGMGSAPASPCRSLSSQRQLGEEESSRVPGVWGAAVGSVGRSCLCSCWRHWGPGPDREVHLSADTSGPCWAAQRAVWVGRVLQQDSGLGLLPAMAPRGGVSEGGGEARRVRPSPVLDIHLHAFSPPPPPLSPGASARPGRSQRWGHRESCWPPGLPVQWTPPGVVSFGFSSFSSPMFPPPAETSSRYSPRPLRVPPAKLARWVGHCGQQLRGGWIQR